MPLSRRLASPPRLIALWAWLLALSHTLFAVPVAAQSGGGYTITQSVIASGGGSSSGGTFSLAGTAGQPATDKSGGGAFTLAGGFWPSGPTAPTAACSFSLSPLGTALPVEGGTGNLLVQTLTQCHWNATSQAAWITLTSGLSGAGTGAVSYTVAANPGPEPRSGVITIEDQSFTITQAGSCRFSLSPSRLPSFTSLGGQARISVSDTGGCPWTVVTEATFISVLTDASGINLLVAPNPDRVARRGLISVAGQQLAVLQAAQFADVPPSHPLYDYISRLSAAGISAGCGDGNFCPDAAVTREQIAIFIERSLGVFTPPAPSTQRFADVPSSRPGYAYIDDFAARGITSGCGGGNYCPDASVTREQMAVFLVRALHAPGYLPAQPQQPRFADVPLSSPFAAYIEELAARGITAGCGGGNYCPGAVVTRGQMAVFLVKAFGL